MQREIVRGRRELTEGVAIQRESAVRAEGAAREGVGVVTSLLPRHEEVERIATAAQKMQTSALLLLFGWTCAARLFASLRLSSVLRIAELPTAAQFNWRRNARWESGFEDMAS